MARQQLRSASSPDTPGPFGSPDAAIGCVPPPDPHFCPPSPAVSDATTLSFETGSPPAPAAGTSGWAAFYALSPAR